MAVMTHSPGLRSTNSKEIVDPVLMPEIKDGLASAKSIVIAGHFNLLTGPWFTVTVPV
jgi:hypothetical protein